MRLHALLTVVIATLLATGCTLDNQVIEQLPSPIVATAPPPPPVPIAPPPVPAPEPEPAQPKTLALSGAIIVVDAGHGGKDPGAEPPQSRLQEKTIVLAIARQVASRLEDRGANVIMSRDDDRFIELDDRAAMAERNRADLLVSIHADSAARVGASGATLYIAYEASSRSQRAARAIESAMSGAGLKVRGIVRKGFRVLVGHSRPAVLVECGFLTNPSDAARLNNATQRKRVATAIAEGIIRHFTR